MQNCSFRRREGEEHALMGLHFSFERVLDYFYSTMSNMGGSAHGVGRSFLA